MGTKQPDVLAMAEALRKEGLIFPSRKQASDALLRLHTENATLQAGYDAARLEIASLHAQLEAVGAGGVSQLVPTQEPMFWVRLLQDGLYQGPIHNAKFKSDRSDMAGSWSPLYPHQAPQPAAQALAPTGAEIDELWREATTKPALTSVFVRSFARAVLAKWGAQPVAAPHVQKTAENVHVAADVYKKAQESNMSALAGMPEPAGIITVMSYKTFLDLSVSEWRDEYSDGEYPVFTAAQVQAMLDEAPRNAPLYDPDDVAFSAWCCAMDDGITASPKGGQYAD